MIRKSISLSVLVLISCSCIVSGFKMKRTIQGVGEWYYKILMTVGSCKDRLLFSEQQIWGRVRMNRIFDIYYESKDGNFKVSRVEIRVIINESDVMAYSEEGVGHAMFSATVYLPLNTFVIFYSLKIFTCSVPASQDENNGDESKKYDEVDDDNDVDTTLI